MSFSDYFIPYGAIITNITNTAPAVITTASPLSCDDGYIVRLVIPKNCGMQQMNNQTGKVTKLAPTIFSIPVDASNFDSFAYTSLDQVAQVVPVGVDSVSVAQAEVNAKNITPET
jgi:hypothetical protein